MQKQILVVSICLLLGIILGYCLSIFIFDLKFDYHVKRQIFNECFDYYTKNGGSDVSLIEVCKDKASGIK